MRSSVDLNHLSEAQLRDLADEVQQKYEPVMADDGTMRPWDIEFGFVDGELTLFQIRPLVERGQVKADRLLATLLPTRSDRAAHVDLAAAPVEHASQETR